MRRDCLEAHPAPELVFSSRPWAHQPWQTKNPLGSCRRWIAPQTSGVGCDLFAPPFQFSACECCWSFFRSPGSPLDARARSVRLRRQCSCGAAAGVELGRRCVCVCLSVRVLRGAGLVSAAEATSPVCAKRTHGHRSPSLPSSLVLIGGAAFPLLLGGAAFPFLLGGAAFPPPPLRSFWWCCVPSLLLGWCCLPPLLACGWCCSVFLLLGGGAVLPSPFGWCCISTSICQEDVDIICVFFVFQHCKKNQMNWEERSTTHTREG